MAKCENRVSFYTESGRELKVQCGRTDPYGNRTVCDRCREDQELMNRLERHERATAADDAWCRSAGWGEM